MKRKLILLLMFIPVMIFGGSYVNYHTLYTPAQAWYQYAGPYKIDDKIRTTKKGEIYFEVHTDLSPPKTKDRKFNSKYLKSNDYYTAYLINSTDTTAYVGHQDGSLIMIQEVINTDNEWQPIEYWYYSWCGNSYFGGPSIAPNEYLIVPINTRSGSFKTKVRLKLKIRRYGAVKTIIYSEPFNYSVDPNLLIKDSVDSILNDTLLKKFNNKSYLD